MHDYVAAPHMDFAAVDNDQPPKPPSHSTWVVVIITVLSIGFALANKRPGLLTDLFILFCIIPALSETGRWVRSMVLYGYRRLAGFQLKRSN